MVGWLALWQLSDGTYSNIVFYCILYAGVCSSSVLDDNYFRYGPQHVLLPGPATFNSKSEEATWLEIRLDKKTFLAGLLLLCSQDAQPIQAILLPDDGLRSGGSSIFQTKTQ